MTSKTKLSALPKQISVLIVDDSLIFRKLLRGIFQRTHSIKIIGEAVNGIEALDMILKRKPDVIIMDMEMPLMDGVTSLQHLMIHKPTPTIMVSSLTSEGTARGFDAIKYGAVDFVCKDSFFQKNELGTFDQEIVYKVLYASKVMVRPVEPAFPVKDDEPNELIKQSDIIFCEECGAKNVFEVEQTGMVQDFICQQCGDILEVGVINKYKRINFITVIGSGTGGYTNLLRIIPKLPGDIDGAIIAIIYEESDHVDEFTEYLNAVSNIKVERIKDGVSIEGGVCYIVPSTDKVYMKQHTAQYTMRTSPTGANVTPIDLLMKSITSVFKEKVAGLILSGVEQDGELGINAIKENNGLSIVLNSANCLCKEMGENILRRCIVDKIVDEKDATQFIVELHQSTSSEPITA